MEGSLVNYSHKNTTRNITNSGPGKGAGNSSNSVAYVVSVDRFGIITYRIDSNNEVDTTTRTCGPLDRSITKYPMANEIVRLELIKGTNYYTDVIGVLDNPTYNQYVMSKDAVTSDINKVQQADSQPKIYKQLAPFEGDFILQGRFGTSIRFGSTQLNTTTPNGFTWSDPKGSSGVSGDGIIVIRADREYTTDDTDSFTQEHIDFDDSSIYIATSQKIPITLATTVDVLKTWSYTTADPENSTEYDEENLRNTLVFDRKTNVYDDEGNLVPNQEDLAGYDFKPESVEGDTSLKNNPEKVQIKRSILDIDNDVNKYTAGSQIVINSDRIILNSRDNYLLLFGSEGVSISSPRSVNIDAKEDIHIYSDDRLLLGLPGRGLDLASGGGITKAPSNKAQPTIDQDYEPLVLGQKLADLLEDLIETIANAVSISPTGDSAFKEAERATFNQIKARIPEMLSTYAFVDGISHGGPDATDEAESLAAPALDTQAIDPINPTGISTQPISENGTEAGTNIEESWFDEDGSDVDPNTFPQYT